MLSSPDKRGDYMKKLLAGGAIAAAIWTTTAWAIPSDPVVSPPPRSTPSNARGGGPAQPPSDTQALDDALVKAAQAFDGGGMRQLAPELRRIVASPQFGRLSEPKRHGALAMLGVAEEANDKSADALVAFQRASEMPSATRYDWYMRFALAAKVSDLDEETTAFTTLARRYPTALGDIRDEAIIRLAMTAINATNGPQRRFELLSALDDAGWRPASPFIPGDSLKRDYAATLIERGQPAKAAKVAGQVTAPKIIASMRADNRFADIVRADPSHYDVRAAAEAHLVAMRQASSAAPDQLQGINAVAETLRQLGRDDEALKLLDDALARATPKVGETSPFSDAREQVNWTMDIRSEVLFDLGRGEEAVAQLAKAARRPEGTAPNVSQALNLAELNLRLGRPKDALGAIEDAGSEMSPYGRMVLESNSACAAFQLGDTSAYERSLNYLKAHSRDNLRALAFAQLCANSLDDAAKTYVALLSDPERRTEVLANLQDWDEPSGATTFDKTIRQRRLEVLARPEVAKVVAKFGSIQHVPLIG